MTVTTITVTYPPRIWPGCLHCYNSGRLVGRWFDLEDWEQVSIESIHDARHPATVWCEEILCLDTEHLPTRGEPDLIQVSRWAEVYAEVGEQDWPAYCAWVESAGYAADADGLPDTGTFRDAYAGHWPDFSDYGWHLIESTDMLGDWPEQARSYFDFEKWLGDQRYSHSVEPAPHGGVYVFREC
ncbi:antirestriction protein ArdA [Micrococcus sp. FDAARGOS_333]|uniref:antirestriction protein ArdA n=1 Tax=Micrococcus sp. FDAARGOS_333 TaxID=1930558 RepID=UPI000B4E7B21|nr:antirestriction protein ArdA [Micrococcus sp. FDAARGOS_333]PNL17288.1 antirestriction protein ArdA [Micrococcus sp. FDAARGOS_333]